MLTVIYSNKMITNIVTLVSIVLLSISSLVAITDTQTNDMFHSIEIFIAIILFIGCNLITNFINDIEKDKNDIIKAGAFKQLQLEELIKCDPLTGLYNMSSFYNMLDATIKNSEMPLSIAVIDIDNFKSVNDTWGHEKANEVLIYIAAQLQACCSTYGYVFRYGGEEFTIVFPYITPTQAKAMIEIAQDNIYQHDFDTIPQQKITFSCGIAAYSSSEYNAHDFFQLADKIMYQAKFSGKNKILIGSA
jgi:diguanylate cyclase (GGDEF)-like protein